MTAKFYKEKLKDPRWQKKRLKILEKMIFSKILFSNKALIKIFIKRKKKFIFTLFRLIKIFFVGLKQ